MRWWLNTDHKTFSVDNAAVAGIDCSALDPAIWMVQWTDGKGEIELQIDGDTNDNGLRSGFWDITPYVQYGFFKQFLQRCPRLTLEQAKKVQIDLIKQLYECKRQSPYHYPVAAGDYWWDATNVALSSTTGGVPNLTLKVNELSDKLDAYISSLNTKLVGYANDVNNIVVGGTNTNVVAVGNALVAQINDLVVNAYNQAFADVASQVNSVVTYPGNVLINYINDTMLGLSGLEGGSGNTINFQLQRISLSGHAEVGLDLGIVHYTGAFGDISAYSTSSITATFTNVGLVTFTTPPWQSAGHVTPANTQWIPYGGINPVNVTPAEQTAILQGISDRTEQLYIIKNRKIGEVNALTIISDVINYDVLADWPDVPMPPGMLLEAPVLNPSGGVTVIGGSASLPSDAPNDGLMYGRQNASWQRAVAITNDIVDGGNF